MKKIALLFAGQGSQYIGMGRSLYEGYGAFRETLEEAGDILKIDMQAMFYSGSMEQLSLSENTQPALFAYGVAAYKVWLEEHGVMPVLGAGHSLGELTALCCSGAIDFADGLRLTRQRAKLMQQCQNAGAFVMAVVDGIESSDVQAACKELTPEKERVELACYNSLKQTVLVGSRAAVDEVCRKLEAEGADIRLVNMSVPSHCSILKEASVDLRQYLSGFSFRPFSWTVVSNIDALPYTRPAEIYEKLPLQLVRPVRWYDTVSYMRLQGIDLFIDIGPKSTIKKLLQGDGIDERVFSLDSREDFKALLTALKEKGDTDSIGSEGKQLSAFLAKCMAVAACTRNDCNDEASYFEGVVKPSRELRSMFLGSEKDEKKQDDYRDKAIRCLDIILKTKLVPEDEINSLMQEVNAAGAVERRY